LLLLRAQTRDTATGYIPSIKSWQSNLVLVNRRSPWSWSAKPGVTS